MGGCGWGVASAAVNTGTGNQAIAVDCEGNTPKACLYFLVRATALDTITSEMMASWGMSDGTTSRCLVNMSDNGQGVASHDVGRRAQTTKVLIATSTGDQSVDAVAGEASHSSFGTDTVTISVDTAFTSGWLAIVWAFYGDDLQAKVVEVTAPASIGGTQASPSAGFAPNLAFAIALPGGFSAVTATSSRGSFGWASKDGSGTKAQGHVSFFERNKPTTSTRVGTAFRDDSVASRFTVSTTGAVTDEGQTSLDSFDSDGVTVKTLSAANGNVLALLLLKTGSQRVWQGFPTLTVNSTGDKTVTSPGWKAGFLGGLGGQTTSAQRNAIQTANTASLFFAIGAGRIGGTTRNASVYSEAAQAPSDTKSLLSSKFLEPMNGGAAIDYSLTIVSDDPAGFKLNCGTASAGDHDVLLLALEARHSEQRSRRITDRAGAQRTTAGRGTALGGHAASPAIVTGGEPVGRVGTTPRHAEIVAGHRASGAPVAPAGPGTSPAAPSARHGAVPATRSPAGGALPGAKPGAGSASSSARHHAPSVSGRTVVARFGANWLRAMTRFRLERLIRLRFKPLVEPIEEQPHAQPVRQVPKGTIVGPGLRRGRVIRTGS